MPIRLPLRRPTSNLPRNTILIQIRFVTVCSSNMWLIRQLLTRPHATSVLTRSSSSVEHVKACLHNTSEAPTALSSSSFCDAQGMFELCLAEDYDVMDPDVLTQSIATIATLKKRGAHRSWHKHSTFLQHLVGVHNILRLWGQGSIIGRVGLFHSAYSNSYVIM